MNKKRLNTLNSLRYSLQTQLLTQRWSDISVQLISKEAKVSIGTFYNYFDSKEDALDDLKIKLTSILKNDLLSLLATYSSAIDKIVITVKYFMLISSSGSTWSNYLFNGSSFIDRLSNGIQDILNTLIREGIEEGNVEPLDIPHVIEYIESGIFSFSRNSLSMSCKDDVVVDLVLRTLDVPANQRCKVLTMACPVTPLMPLPILNISNSESI